MIVLGADTHKRSHTIAGVELATGQVVGDKTVAVGARGFAALLIWGARARRRPGLGAGALPARLGRAGAVPDRPRRTRMLAGFEGSPRRDGGGHEAGC
jgi:hypothetical protein